MGIKEVMGIKTEITTEKDKQVHRIEEGRNGKDRERNRDKDKVKERERSKSREKIM